MIVRQMRERGCRITKARLTLLDVILEQDCSSCKEIYYIASQTIPGIGLKEIVLHHHERYDGKGYPSGLKAEEIPVGARIIAICDSIDAMTSTRHYRNAMTLSQCYVEIERNLGKMYDPIIGKYVLEHWEEITRHIGER